jgi:isocitrate dehydrogenase (NAD+)
MSHEVTLIEGDGIGPEVIGAAEIVLASTGVDLRFDRQLAGMASMRNTGVRLPEATEESIRRTKVALKGPLTNDPGMSPPADAPRAIDLSEGHTTAMIAIRQRLGMNANFRWAKTLGSNGSAADGTDIWVIREVSEDVYNGTEISIDDRAAVLVKKTTWNASERVARDAFEFARTRRRGKVAVVHKAEVLPLTDGLFRDAARVVAAEYPDIQFEEIAPDAAAFGLVRRPRTFDVILTQFFTGDIFADLCAGLVGGVGMMGGMSLGSGYGIFEATHGSAPKHAGNGTANPTAMILSAAFMLSHLGEHDAADAVVRAVDEVIREARAVTPDLRGDATTTEMATAIAKAI